MKSSLLSVSDAALDQPDAPALVLGEKSYTFANLEEMLGGERARLLERSNADGLVCLVCDLRLESLLRLYACLEEGVPLLLLHPLWPENKRQELVAQVQSDYRASSLKDEAQVLLCTSGSSGKPKVVVLSHAALCASARASEENLPWHEGDRWLLSLPFAHVGGLSILIRCLLGRKTVVVGTTRSRDADFYAEIQARGVSLLSLVPTQLSDLLHSRDSLPGGVRAVLVGGAPCPEQLRTRARARGIPLLCTYGMTEMSSQIATQSLSRSSMDEDEGGAGFPLSGVEVKFHASGELAVRGPSMMRGYLCRSPEGSFDDGWFNTGDLGRLSARGAVVIQGRTDHLIISGGENISPEWVETELSGLSGIRQICVVGLPDEKWGQRVVAVLSCAPGAENTPLWYREAKARLPAYAVPKDFVCFLELPLGDNGKIDRSALLSALLRKQNPE